MASRKGDVLKLHSSEMLSKIEKRNECVITQRLARRLEWRVETADGSTSLKPLIGCGRNSTEFVEQSTKVACLLEAQFRGDLLGGDSVISQ